MKVSISIGGCWRTEIVVTEEMSDSEIMCLIEKVSAIPWYRQISTPAYDGNKIQSGLIEELLIEWSSYPFNNHPLHYITTVSQLHSWVASGADINIKDSYGRTPLMMIIKNNPLCDGKNFEELIKEMLLCGADVECVDRYERTALFYIINRSSKNSCKIIRLLIDAGCNPHARDNDGEIASCISMEDSGGNIFVDPKWLLSH